MNQFFNAARIDPAIYGYTYDQLVHWLRHEAGSSIPEYFSCAKQGLLDLQQVPEEYARLLLYFKTAIIKTYLELGVGCGGSFLLNSFFNKDSLIKAHCVDNCAYGQPAPAIQGKIDFLKTLIPAVDVQWHKSNTATYFNEHTELFDCIFIDADHTYEGVVLDYSFSLRRLTPGGILIFHDIASDKCPGVRKLWKQLKQIHPTESCLEFVAAHNTNCGIGILKV
jgi:hypothetical protein